MAYPNNFVKVTFGGTIYSQADIWTCGINYGSPDGDIDLQALKNTAAKNTLPNHVREWFTDTRSQISNRATLEWVKLAYIGADGKYELDADIFEYDDLVTGSVATSSYVPIPQHTTAISFNSEVRRGAGRFGRIYPPLNGVVYNDGMVSTEGANQMRDAAAKLLANMGVALSLTSQGYLPPIIASQRTEKHNEIVGVRVGRVVDTQRTRRNAFQEMYTSTAGITPAL